MDTSFHGYRGVCGSSYFLVSHDTFLKKLHPKTRIIFNNMHIAYRELLAVILAFQVFAATAPNFFNRINCNNTNILTWLNNGRLSRKIGFSNVVGNRSFQF